MMFPHLQQHMGIPLVRIAHRSLQLPSVVRVAPIASIIPTTSVAPDPPDQPHSPLLTPSHVQCPSHPYSPDRPCRRGGTQIAVDRPDNPRHVAQVVNITQKNICEKLLCHRRKDIAKLICWRSSLTDVGDATHDEKLATTVARRKRLR